MSSIREKFVASDVWLRLWLVGSLAFALDRLFVALEPTLFALRSPAYLLLTLFAVLATVALTLVVSPILAFFVFDDMTQRQARRNGGPFAVGDRVFLIAGRQAGKEGVVTSQGQCQTLRITLDGEDREHGDYSHYQLKRASEPSEPCDASELPSQAF